MSGDSNEKYSLRPRSAKKKSKVLQESSDEDHNQTGAAQQQQQTKLKAKPPPLSKYRRKTANARERSRMHEINVAFETLRQVVPSLNTVAVAIEAPIPECTNSTKAMAMNEKLTKITTLRLAMRYIQMLNDLLQESDSSDEMTSCSQLPEAQEMIQVPANLEPVQAPLVAAAPTVASVESPAISVNSAQLFAPTLVSQPSVNSCLETLTKEIFTPDAIVNLPVIATTTSTTSTTTAMPTIQQIPNILINNNNNNNYNNNNNNQNYNLNYIQSHQNNKQVALVDFLSDCSELDCLLMESSDGETSSLLASSNSPHFSDSLSSVDFDDPTTLLTCHDFVDQPLSICEFNEFFLV